MLGLNMTSNPLEILASLDQRVNAIVDACTACGACVSVCPTPAINGIDATNSEQITAGVLDILRQGSGPENAESWAQACCGSGFCQSVCEHGIDPRFMLNMARRSLLKQHPPAQLKLQGKTDFKKMSRGVRLISRLQLTPELMARLSPSSHPDREEPPDLIFYTGCNMLKTPHIGLLCMDVLDLLEVRYEVHGGPSNCCGIMQLRAGDDESSVRQGGKTIERFAATGASKVLSWCPTCQIQFGETLLPSYSSDGTEPFETTMFPVFLASHLEKLKPLMTRPVKKRVALHEYPGSAGVTQAVIDLLSAVPGIELIDLKLPRAGYQMSSMLNPDYAKKHLSDLLEAGKAANITTFAGVYHGDHRELVRHEPHWPFEVVNFMDLIGESLGLHRPDVFKRLRLMNDADRIMEQASQEITDNNLNLEDVRNVILSDMLGEQVLETP